MQYQQQAAPAPLPTLMSLDEMNAPPGYKFAGYAPAPEVGESNPGYGALPLCDSDTLDTRTIARMITGKGRLHIFARRR